MAAKSGTTRTTRTTSAKASSATKSTAKASSAAKTTTATKSSAKTSSATKATTTAKSTAAHVVGEAIYTNFEDPAVPVIAVELLDGVASIIGSLEDNDTGALGATVGSKVDIGTDDAASTGLLGLTFVSGKIKLKKWCRCLAVPMDMPYQPV